MLTGSIPPTGIPMPYYLGRRYISYGFMRAIGILCNVGKSKENGGKFKKSSFKINWFNKGKKKKIRFNFYLKCMQFMIKKYTFFFVCMV